MGVKPYYGATKCTDRYHSTIRGRVRVYAGDTIPCTDVRYDRVHFTVAAKNVVPYANITNDDIHYTATKCEQHNTV